MNKIPRQQKPQKPTHRKPKNLTRHHSNANLKTQPLALSSKVPSRGRKSPAKGFRKRNGGFSKPKNPTAKKKSLTTTSQSVNIKSQSPTMDRKEHRGAFLRQKRKMQLTKKTKPATIKKLTPASGPQGATRGFLTKEKTYLLIDGENFVHRIEESLKTRNIIKNRAQLKKIDYDILFDFAEKATKRYYSTILRMPKKDHPLYKKAQKIRQWQFAWVPYLISKNIQYIKSGYLRTREGKVCPKCGAIVNETYAEKGVDVRMAVDMIESADPETTIFLVSSDTDLLPAITVAKRHGAHLVYVAFEDKIIKLISDCSDETIIITNSKVKKAYKEANKK